MNRRRTLGSDDVEVCGAGTSADTWAIVFGFVTIAAGIMSLAFRLTAARRRKAAAAGLGDAGTGFGDALASAPGRSKKHPRLMERHKTGGMTLSMYTDKEMPIDMRVGLIQDLTREGAKHPEIQSLARAIVGHGRQTVRVGKYTYSVEGAGCAPSDHHCMIDAVGKWTAANVRYTGDIAPVKMGRGGPVEAVDLFQSARRTLELGGDDCDGHDTFNCSVIEAIGSPGLHCRHRVTAPRGESDWAHIYSVAETGKELIPMDTTLPGYRTGREAPHAKQADFKAF